MLGYDPTTVSHGSGSTDGLARSSGEDAEETGGCSTAPAGGPMPALVLLGLAGLVVTRRRG